ncbi:rhamnan synthesis F family protein [Hyphomonas sp. NPDC076881]|uniref:rhamnan synthesis F family protein n=1 Tax=Hyphomonas sp. NPDC076881 TaxID=3390569 RepID=UPI003D088A69
MHRSGTSAITRGLQVLGVDLGESLLPAASGNNEKGFFEDADIVSLNDRILGQAGRSWSSLENIPAEVLTGPEYFDLRAEATAMLAAKLHNRERLGLKDPRLCMLMPFWKCVLDDLGVDVSFVIALRNPLAAARSLRARDGIVIEKGVALWGQHMLSAARATAGHPRVFVSFDHLMNNAVGELQRIAEKLDLPFPGVDSPEIQDYETNFLEDSLRHQLISDRELRRSGRASEIVADLFEKLLAMAAPAAPGRLPNKDLDIEDLIHRFADLPPLFRAIDTLEGALAKASANATHQAGLAAEHERIRDIVKQAHDDACNQRDAAMAQCEILSTEISNLKVQLDQQVARTAELDRERNATQKAHDDACNQRDAAVAQHQTLSAEVSTLKTQLDNQTAAGAELVRIRDTLKQAHDDACSQRDAAVAQHQTLSAEVSTLKAQLDNQIAVEAELVRIRDTLKQAHDDACSQRDAAVAQHQTLSAEVSTLKAQLDNQIAVEAELVRIRDVLKQAHDDACRQRDAAVAQHQTLSAEVSTLKTQLDNQTAAGAELVRIRDTLKQAHDDACSQRDAAVAQHQTLSAEVSTLKAQLDNQIAVEAELVRIRDTLKQAHDDACSQRDAAVAQHQTLSAEVSTLKAQLDNQIAVEAELVRIRDVLKQAHDDACRQRDALAAQLEQESSLVAEITRIRDEVQQAHDEACIQRDAALAGRSALSAEIGSLKQQMKQEQEALERQAEAIRAERDSAEQDQRAEKSRADRLKVLADQQAASVHHLQQALERAQAESLAYTQSTSWKLTAPLRGLSRILKPGRPPARSLTEARSPATTSTNVWKLAVSNTAAERPLPPPARRPQIADQRGAAPRGSEWLAVVVHAFYPEILDEILSRLATSTVPLKLYVTAPTEAVADVAAKLRASDWPFILLNTDNRGRDAAPFIASLSAVRNDNATMVLKLHTKRSPHLPDGDHWRTVLYDQLLLAGGPEQAIRAFAKNPDLGILAPAGHILSTADFMGTNAGNVRRVSENLGISQDMVLKSAFVAGSMFYARMDIFAGLDETGFSADQFEVERGQIDGTLAHAIERMTGVLAERRGLRMAFLNDPAGTPRPLGLGAFPYV